MQTVQTRRTFDLDDDAILNQQIESISAFKSNTFVHNRHWDLFAKRNARIQKLECQALRICGLEKSWSERSMDFYRTAEYSIHERIAVTRRGRHACCIRSHIRCDHLKLSLRVVQTNSSTNTHLSSMIAIGALSALGDLLLIGCQRHCRLASALRPLQSQMWFAIGASVCTTERCRKPNRRLHKRLHARVHSAIGLGITSPESGRQ